MARNDNIAGIAGRRPPEGETHEPSIRIGKEATIADAIAALADAPDGHVGVIDEQGEVTQELWISDPELHSELAGAKEVQQRLLPHAVPKVPGFEFAGRSHSAGHVGGDYWSVKYYREEKIVTCKLADVTGHGIAAAILVAAVKFVSGVLFRFSSSPAIVMERTNHSLLHETSPDRMATMVYAWIYPESRRVRLVNAGHFPAFVCRADGTMVDIPPTGPLLGLLETTYDEIEEVLAPGDLLFFCSDGVAEAGDHKRFGEGAVKEIVAAHRSESANAIADAVFEAAKTRYGTPKDDMSLVIVKAVGTRPAPRSRAAKTPQSPQRSEKK